MAQTWAPIHATGATSKTSTPASYLSGPLPLYLNLPRLSWVPIPLGGLTVSRLPPAEQRFRSLMAHPLNPRATIDHAELVPAWHTPFTRLQRVQHRQLSIGI